MTTIRWPDTWQPEAIAVVAPFVGADQRINVYVGPPETSLFGTLMGGYFYVEDHQLMVIHDHSGRPDVYPWKAFAGPVLEVNYQPAPRKRRIVAYRNPLWVAKLPTGGSAS